MAHFAQLDDFGFVLQVIVVSNAELLDQNGVEQEQIGVAFCRSLFGPETNWVQTSYNKAFRKNFAGLGFYYDVERDAFIPPRPYPEWTLDEETCNWIPPVPMPDDGQSYIWDGTTGLPSPWVPIA